MTAEHAGNVVHERKELGTNGWTEFLKNLIPEELSASCMTDGSFDPIAFTAVFRPKECFSASVEAEKHAKSAEAKAFSVQPHPLT
jgi:hypothetical protein